MLVIDKDRPSPARLYRLEAADFNQEAVYLAAESLCLFRQFACRLKNLGRCVAGLLCTGCNPGDVLRYIRCARRSLFHSLCDFTGGGRLFFDRRRYCGGNFA
jgi:hypothetical protein